MPSSSTEDIWSELCSFSDAIIVLWSVSLLFFLLSLSLLIADTTDQEVILMMNLVLFTPVMVSSLVILLKCADR